MAPDFIGRADREYPFVFANCKVIGDTKSHVAFGSPLTKSIRRVCLGTRSACLRVSGAIKGSALSSNANEGVGIFIRLRIMILLDTPSTRVNTP